MGQIWEEASRWRGPGLCLAEQTSKWLLEDFLEAVSNAGNHLQLEREAWQACP